MKRNCDEMDTVESTSTSGGPQEPLPTAKRLKDKEQAILKNDLTIMDIVNGPNVPPDPERSLLNVFSRFKRFEQHNFVERDPNPMGHSLVNSEYVGKRTYQELMELDANVSNVSQFIAANTGNRVDQIGRQMKYLYENLQQVCKNARVDSDLHMAACNFVKKPGQTYHLYKRASGQKYFSMLSPEDWNGSPPHKYLGSWYLELDQSWTAAEDRRTKFEGLSFLGDLYLKKSVQ